MSWHKKLTNTCVIALGYYLSGFYWGATVCGLVDYSQSLSNLRLADIAN